jgi:hypothetical protein
MELIQLEITLLVLSALIVKVFKVLGVLAYNGIKIYFLIKKENQQKKKQKKSKKPPKN